MGITHVEDTKCQMSKFWKHKCAYCQIVETQNGNGGPSAILCFHKCALCPLVFPQKGTLPFCGNTKVAQSIHWLNRLGGGNSRQFFSRPLEISLENSSLNPTILESTYTKKWTTVIIFSNFEIAWNLSPVSECRLSFMYLEYFPLVLQTRPSS